MSINATLIVQMIVFAILVWFTMKFVWPPIIAAMQERANRIADGLAAADRATHNLAVAQEKAVERLKEAFRVKKEQDDLDFNDVNKSL